MGRRGRLWWGILLRALVILAGAVVVLAMIGFFIGGWGGAYRGAMWGFVAGAMAIPGMMLAVALRVGDEMAEAPDEDFYRRY